LPYGGRWKSGTHAGFSERVPGLPFWRERDSCFRTKQPFGGGNGIAPGNGPIFGCSLELFSEWLEMVKAGSFAGGSRSRKLLDYLPFLTEDFVDDLDELIAVKALQRIEVPASLVRNLVTRFAFFRHISSQLVRQFRPLACNTEHSNSIQVPDISFANPMPRRKVIPMSEQLGYFVI
jgi:hypothetical protein